MIPKLGKKPAENDPRDLRFYKYLTTRALGPAPSSVYWYHDVVNQVGSSNPWPMYGNDLHGDCTCAAAGHMIQIWTANAGVIVTPTLEEIMSVYNLLSPNDDGCTLGQVLRYWRATGFGDHKILAWVKVALENHEQAKQAIDLFGNLYIGVDLPDAVYQNAPDVLTAKWYLGDEKITGQWSPDPSNGHCVNAIAYDDAGLGLVTWGEYKTCDWEFYDAFVTEAYVVLSQEWISTEDGGSPSGFDLAALQADLAAL